ncbi:MAG: hypothetical protein ABSH56_03820 [Bryobacteraceae bacterium]
MNTKTCPTCKVTVWPMADGACPGCRAPLGDMPPHGASTGRSEPGTASPAQSTILIERKGAKRVGPINWIVSLDDMAAGQLPEGGRMAIPVGIGTHAITFAFAPTGGLIQPPKLGALSVTGPDDFNMLFCVGLEGGTWTPFRICVAEKRRLKPEEAQLIATPPEGPRLPSAQTAHPVPTVTADLIGAYQAPKGRFEGFNFTQVFSQKTAILFAFYWLWRWLFPAYLPEVLRELEFRFTVIPCGILGAVWTGISLVRWDGSAPRQKH